MGSETHPASYFMGTGVLLRGKSGRGVKLTIHLHLAPMLRMSGTIPSFTLYNCMTGTAKTLLLWVLLLFVNLHCLNVALRCQDI